MSITTDNPRPVPMISKIPRLALGKIPPPLLAASAGLNCYALFMLESALPNAPQRWRRLLASK